MHRPETHLPMDRRQALARGEGLADRCHGSALFADISGFTPLAKTLVEILGRRRGAEELACQLDRVYEALIATVHGYQGSVVGFVGDGITCWFDRDDGLRAAACGLAMQQAMQPFVHAAVTEDVTATLSIKVGIACGPARRFRVGDPEVQFLDVLAGETLRWMSLAEGVARPGEVVVAPSAVGALAGRAMWSEWRTHPSTRDPFGLLAALVSPVTKTPWPAMKEHALLEEKVRPWLLPLLYQHLQEHRVPALAGISLTAALRPATALFVKFSGIDYDGNDDAGAQLDAFVRRVQQIATHYGGHVIQQEPMAAPTVAPTV